MLMYEQNWCQCPSLVQEVDVSLPSCFTIVFRIGGRGRERERERESLLRVQISWSLLNLQLSGHLMPIIKMGRVSLSE